MLKFEPLSEEKLQEINLIPEGTYYFVVHQAKDSVSSSGHQQIELVLKVTDSNERVRIMFDYLTAHESFLFKVRHFCNVTKQIDKYEKGILGACDCADKTGYVRVGIKKSSTDRNGKEWPAKNYIKDYVFGQIIDSLTTETFNDTIPF